MQIVIDTREQRPYQFPEPVKTITKTLETGDYSLSGFEDRICIERKSLPDLFGSLGKGRARFEREFQRMSEFQYACLMIECGFLDVFCSPPKFARVHPKSVFRSVYAWSIRYGIHVCWATNREYAQKITYIMLERWWKEYGNAEVSKASK